MLIYMLDIVAYEKKSANTGWVVEGVIDGTSLDFSQGSSSAQQFSSNNIQRITVVHDPNVDKFAIAYRDTTDSEGNALSFTSAIPEFPTLLLPIASVLAITSFHWRRSRNP
ncbi:MAG: hypothetical protein QF519_04970 [Candidatus Poseidoniia archaeon]|nr:hypothetical protein [Candidatus Poseidoniia archaeon]